MERNIRHVQRWLERCLEAYKNRHRGAALVELESARAELEIAREMLEEELAGQKRSNRLFRGRFSRVALTSLILLFALALPTAHRTDRIAASPSLDKYRPSLSLEVVTEEELLLLQNLRRPPAMARTDPTQAPSKVPVVPHLTAKAEDNPVHVIPVEVPAAEVSEKTAKRVSDPRPVSPISDKLGNGVPVPSVEEVLSLLEAGQRALQNPGKGIPIQP